MSLIVFRLLLLIFCVLTSLFAIVLTTLHFDAVWNSRVDRYRFATNSTRDAVDVVYELRDKYFGDSIRTMSAHDLQSGLRSRQRGVSLEVTDLVPSRREEWARSRTRKALSTIGRLVRYISEAAAGFTIDIVRRRYLRSRYKEARTDPTRTDAT